RKILCTSFLKTEPRSPPLPPPGEARRMKAKGSRLDARLARSNFPAMAAPSTSWNAKVFIRLTSDLWLQPLKVVGAQALLAAPLEQLPLPHRRAALSVAASPSP